MSQSPSHDEYKGKLYEIRGSPLPQQQTGRVQMTSRIDPKPSWSAHRSGSFLSKEVSEISRHSDDSFDYSDLDMGFCSDSNSDDMEESVISNPLPTIKPKMHEFKHPSFAIHERSEISTKEVMHTKSRKDKADKAPANPLIVQVAPYPYYPPYNSMQPYPNYPYQYPAYPQYPYPQAYPQYPYPTGAYPGYPPQDYRPQADNYKAAPTKVDCATQYSPIDEEPLSFMPDKVKTLELSIEKSSFSIKSTLEESPKLRSSTRASTEIKSSLSKIRNLTVSKSVSQLQITSSKPQPNLTVEPHLVYEEPVFSKEVSVEEKGSYDEEKRSSYIVKEDSEEDKETSHEGLGFGKSEAESIRSFEIPILQGFECISVQTSGEFPPKRIAKAAINPPKEDPEVPEIPTGSNRAKAWAMEISQDEEGKRQLEAISAKRLQIMHKLQERKVTSSTEARPKSPKSKEELFEIRKLMLKSQKQKTVITEEASEVSSPVKPQSALLQRLANGAKVKVTRKEMRRLTSKFNSTDPSKTDRDEQERKKADLKQRVASAKAYEEKSRQERMQRLKKPEVQ